MNAVTEMPAPLSFSDSAANKVKQLIDEEGNPDLKLRARSRAYHAGDAEVGALAAGAHFDGSRIEVRRVPAHDVGDGLGKAALFPAHDLDRKVAGKSELRFAQAETASRLPARITFCLNSW